MVGNVNTINMLVGIVSTRGKLSGTVCAATVLSGSIRTSGILIGTIAMPSKLAAYTGPYVVTPSMQEHVLDTEGKSMSNNVVVNSVPVHRTKNATGGYTVYIANEVKYNGG